ncbi:MAG: TIGR02391 family protein [Calothrix sp. MO_192.B10]|nr:TIGR02391 family protein [Calothrix sp. MO_192.B10]
MQALNLTETQKSLLQWLVEKVRAGMLNEEEIWFAWSFEGTSLVNYQGDDVPEVKTTTLDALQDSGCLSCDRSRQHQYKCALTSKAYEAVDSNFDAPDTSFIEYLTPLTGMDKFDEQIKTRCLPLLASGGSDSVLWDSVVRTAGVILEERLRDVGAISDPNQTGQGLVNEVFKKNGTLASKFTVDSERQGYRDLYAGIVGSFRNPYAHRLIDPNPEDGGAFLGFVNLLLKKLEALR